MKQAVFTMGLPASGKSSIANARFPHHTVIDCDLHKAAHPDYDPKNPGALHDWSKEMAEKELEVAMTANDDIVVDGTGTNFAPLVKKMRAANRAGFEVVLLYVEVPLEVALARNAKRDRNVDESILRDKSEAIEIAFEICAKEADTVIAVDNSYDK